MSDDPMNTIFMALKQPVTDNKDRLDFDRQERGVVELCLSTDLVRDDKVDLELGHSGIHCQVLAGDGVVTVIARSNEPLHTGRNVRMALIGAKGEPVTAKLRLEAGAEDSCQGRCHLGEIEELRGRLGEKVQLEAYPPRAVPCWLLEDIQNAPCSEGGRECLVEILGTLLNLSHRVWEAALGKQAGWLTRLPQDQAERVKRYAIEQTLIEVAVAAIEKRLRRDEPYPLRWLVGLVSEQLKRGLNEEWLRWMQHDPQGLQVALETDLVDEPTILEAQP